ncbi:MAG TPA: sugar phosphate isomerase/epimerase family protein [Candidatus Paceibacterota bacterium]|jgi:hexulose-6-phosphate isomerase|nr:xylose isomerase [Limisphaerales bacterium]HNR70462.1 sugar phosphate isomerase/epimerase family protein [Verrucomicrobiota bacterium]HRY57675.1 sugar phosphate isomerase/epimerase family protein [Candidatus Paceibacterota bacterium]HNS69104.1 sugar phosphate isomerase/epimerase family protein [Verrucomicrobiota bacterium]HOW79810.1 sugar phosphate isomerase/epimerase family protein [Verrucomicrobiota bacterium]
MQRREFLKTGAGALALAALAPHVLAEAGNPSGAAAVKRPLKRGIMWATVGVKGTVLEKMKAIKEAGFDGVEMMSHMDADEVLRARDATGLLIPSVCGRDHWGKPLTHPDPKVRAEGVEALKQTLRDAKRYGASSVLLVPGVVSKEVAYNEAYERSQAEIRKALPLAQELGVSIAIENVWNHFLLSPLEAARYVDEFNSPAVGWQFDVGNILNYGWPEQWIRILGPRIKVIHIKEFSRKRRDNEGLWKGFEVKLLEGDNNWPAVMKAVDEIGYRGWAITEQGGGDSPEGLKDLVVRLDKILAA